MATNSGFYQISFCSPN